MPLTPQQIVEHALALPAKERALLADRLVESLDPSEDNVLRQLWSKEALRRRDEVRAGKVKTVPGDKAFAAVRRAVEQ